MTDDTIAKICKALGDIHRVHIIKLLTNGELCACKILESLNITQPTLSHHMKILSACDLVKTRKEATWIYYSINCEIFNEFKMVIEKICCMENNCKSCCSSK